MSDITKFTATVTKSRKINLALYGGPAYETEDVSITVTMHEIECPPSDIKKVMAGIGKMVQVEVDKQVDERQKAWLNTKKEPKILD